MRGGNSYNSRHDIRPGNWHFPHNVVIDLTSDRMHSLSPMELQVLWRNWNVENLPPRKGCVHHYAQAPITYNA